VSAGGFALWTEDAGSASTVFTRAGAPDCNDSQPLFGGGGVALDFTRGGVRALYGDGSGGGLSDPLRTRCEGPGLADVARAHPLATGTLPLSAFRSRRVTLLLNRGGAFSSDGYSGTTRSDVTVVLRRLRIRTHIQVYRFPALFARLARSGPPMERILAARIGRRDRSGYRARAHPRAAAGPAR
jgi:hypothetical protein